MDSAEFKRLSRRVAALTSSYGVGYRYGLRRHFHGTESETDEERAAREQNHVEFARGYEDGVGGKPPTPLRHRPPRPPEAPRVAVKPVRTLRLPAESWAKLRVLGAAAWLEQRLAVMPWPDNASPLPSPYTGGKKASTVRLSDDDWRKLRALGMAWLASQLALVPYPARSENDAL